jgi:hypothetical protein
MLCSLKWGLFVFFAIWNFFMPFVVFLYVPETKECLLRRWNWCGKGIGFGKDSCQLTIILTILLRNLETKPPQISTCM